jgi:hypothetical protein
VVHCERELYLVFEYLDLDMKKHFDANPGLAKQLGVIKASSPKDFLSLIQRQPPGFSRPAALCWPAVLSRRLAPFLACQDLTRGSSLPHHSTIFVKSSLALPSATRIGASQRPAIAVQHATWALHDFVCLCSHPPFSTEFCIAI